MAEKEGFDLVPTPIHITKWVKKALVDRRRSQAYGGKWVTPGGRTSMAPGVPKRDWRDTVAPPRQIGKSDPMSMLRVPASLSSVGRLPTRVP